MERWEAPETFVDFVRNRHVELLRFAHVLTGDRHLAEDLVQDALERTGMAWKRLARRDDPEGYTRKIILNRYLNRLRKLKRERLMAHPPEGPPVEDGTADDQVRRALAGLPRQQRAVLVLRYYLDLSEAQIADALGCSVGAVKSNASRGMAKLRAAIAVPDVKEPVR
ncbi:SigE family RNA polymerase sigma factor [Paractinoplanes rishiriensis]|uniref:DNA-directed RNA polymerase sigma-70 factor n=1 Tax=Paractinoplanes rishiriensis TaxID=1050105 RepID=A0A919K3F7_9ACTN|nr:SigE family RNA polymerase sigma factor [Actinoplanes rishiriensis]GIE98819.1 DNA-directed RNA polymerase sigma-70 factor [Actinoplanes rishiriensis]